MGLNLNFLDLLRCYFVDSILYWYPASNAARLLFTISSPLREKIFLTASLIASYSIPNIGTAAPRSTIFDACAGAPAFFANVSTSSITLFGIALMCLITSSVSG